SEALGRYGPAEDAARRLVKATAAGAPMAAQVPPLQLFLIVPIVTDIRFGKWDAALARELPAENLKLHKAVSHYARGFALANKRDFAAAAKERAALAAMLEQNALADVDAAAFGVPGTRIAQVGLALLDGEIARLEGKTDEALKLFAEANEL